MSDSPRAIRDMSAADEIERLTELHLDTQHTLRITVAERDQAREKVEQLTKEAHAARMNGFNAALDPIRKVLDQYSVRMKASAEEMGWPLNNDESDKEQEHLLTPARVELVCKELAGLNAAIGIAIRDRDQAREEAARLAAAFGTLYGLASEAYAQCLAGRLMPAQDATQLLAAEVLVIKNGSRTALDEALAKAERPFRQALWSMHGHTGQYGDDGEMQCGACSKYGCVDYLRAPVHEVIGAATCALQDSYQEFREAVEAKAKTRANAMLKRHDKREADKPRKQFMAAATKAGFSEQQAKFLWSSLAQTTHEHWDGRVA